MLTLMSSLTRAARATTWIPVRAPTRRTETRVGPLHSRYSISQCCRLDRHWIHALHVILNGSFQDFVIGFLAHRLAAFLFPAAFARDTNRVAAVMRLQVIHMRVWLAEGLRSDVILSLPPAEPSSCLSVR